jgi:hypothetical protein
MNSANNQDSGSFRNWTASVLLLTFFCLCDITIVAWSAQVVSAGELVAGWLSFALITFGIMVTVSKLRA